MENNNEIILQWQMNLLNGMNDIYPFKNMSKNRFKKSVLGITK